VRAPTLKQHQLKCERWIEGKEEGFDYVRCKICGFVSRSLTLHVKSEHGISREEYLEKHGPVVCQTTSEIKKSLDNWNWVKRAKEDDPEKFDTWRKELGPKISVGVLNSPTAREARRQNLTALNKSETQRKISSVTAQRTSARRDIQLKRGENLRRWRVNNPEKFSEIFTKLSKCFASKPELTLHQLLVQEFSSKNFVRNQHLKRRGKFLTTKSHVRQVDIYSPEEKIVVEFDGVYHFKPVKSDVELAYIQRKDQELNHVLVEEGFTLIRVSYDQFKYARGGHFREECLSEIRRILNTGERGLFLIGSSYV
jgi:very-short-patch-repair endonuclease